MAALRWAAISILLKHSSRNTAQLLSWAKCAGGYVLMP